MKLVVGLGNPVLRQAQDKDKYSRTRHNLGFMVLDKIADGPWNNETKFKAEVCILKSEDIILVKPQTYMNNSGMSVKLVADYYKIFPKDIIVVYDELDLPLGKIKVRLGGAAAGHHGVESIIKVLGTDKFIRVRLGIGPSTLQHVQGRTEQSRSATGSGSEKFVMEPFLPQEKSTVKHMIKQAIALLHKGITTDRLI